MTTAIERAPVAPAALSAALAGQIPAAVARLDHWLQSMRQPGGYAGPVSHYWQNRLLYAGPGLDWRYEGLLVGYAELHARTGEERWRERAALAAEDLAAGQTAEGHYRASRFEINPGTLGTPHEAAASLGLLHSLPLLPDPERFLAVARRNLGALSAALWDGTGFNDHRTVPGRVPNKLATLAQALLLLAGHERAAGQDAAAERATAQARSALDDVLRFQEAGGEVHQYATGAAGADGGDGRYFPYYNARCVEPLLLGQKLLQDERYGRAAGRILERLTDWQNPDGSWPQIVYRGGRRAEFPRWYAGGADLLWAYHVAGRPLPGRALERLLDSQLENGAFPTGEGFAAQVRQKPAPADPRDLLGVVGWNDKVLRLLAHLLPVGAPLPEASVGEVERPVLWRGRPATFQDRADLVQVVGRDGRVLYRWNRAEVWAVQTGDEAEVR